MKIINRHKKDTLLMNPKTGSVDTAENWESDIDENSWNDLQKEFDSLVEVEEGEDGGYIEVR